MNVLLALLMIISGMRYLLVSTTEAKEEDQACHCYDYAPNGCQHHLQCKQGNFLILVIVRGFKPQKGQHTTSATTCQHVDRCRRDLDKDFLEICTEEDSSERNAKCHQKKEICTFNVSNSMMNRCKSDNKKDDSEFQTYWGYSVVIYMCIQASTPSEQPTASQPLSSTTAATAISSGVTADDGTNSKGNTDIKTGIVGGILGMMVVLVVVALIVVIIISKRRYKSVERPPQRGADNSIYYGLSASSRSQARSEDDYTALGLQPRVARRVGAPQPRADNSAHANLSDQARERPRPSATDETLEQDSPYQNAPFVISTAPEYHIYVNM